MIASGHAEAPVNLTNCDREPIHIPGAILPHGAMLVLDPDTLEVLQVAGDTARLLGRRPAALLGQGAESVFRTRQVERLKALCRAPQLVKPRYLLDPALRVVPDTPIDASAHRSDGLLVLEFEEADPENPYATDPLARVQDMLCDLEGAISMHEFCQAAAESVRATAAYDRVMVYRFQPDDSGWVFAESRRDDLTPLLDLHYPASDIPKQARELYLRNWLRLIAEVDYTPAPLDPAVNPRTGQPLDMSYATLRDVSPIHREYLRNMGVAASMSISIVREGKLWGLIACHHYTPKRPARHIRAICELFGAVFSLQLEARERAELLEARLASHRILDEIVRDLAVTDDYAEGIMRQAPRLLKYIDAGGIALHRPGKGGVVIKVNEEVQAHGDTPPADAIAALTAWLEERMDGCGGLFLTDRLPQLWPEGAAFAGVGAGLLALSISREPRDFVLWFRPEVVETVRWAGDPTKPVEFGVNGERLTPRKSFEAWTEEVRGRASPWTEAEGNAAFDLRMSLLDTVLRRIDAAARERERAREHERLVMNELDHRAKNTLANVQALVAHTSRSAVTLEEYVAALEQRIRAMSRAHGLITESRWIGASVESIVRQELEQHRGAFNIVIEGPRVTLSPKAALSLSLATHELATNAAKYGALTAAGGTVEVRWWMTEAGGLAFTWREAGGPPVTPPKRRGFGSTLIERALSIETGGRSTLYFEPEGVVCEVALPRDALVGIGPPSVTASPAQASERVAKCVPIGRPRILVVEDAALIVMWFEAMLENLDWTLVGPATRLADALSLAASERIDAALLDVNLDGEMTWSVADVLRRRNIPFAFTTGYDGAAVLPERFASTAVIGKPFREGEIRHSLLRMLAMQGRAHRAT